MDKKFDSFTMAQIMLALIFLMAVICFAETYFM